VITQALLALVFGFLGLMVAVPLLATVMVTVQVLYVQKRPTRGSGGGSVPTHSPDLDEPLEGARAIAR
jgi:predicted PurR-regulated permease PerM